MKSLNIKEQEVPKAMTLNYALFQRIFCRCVFKQSLIEVLHEIEEGINRKKAKPEPTYNHQASFKKQHSVKKHGGAQVPHVAGSQRSAAGSVMAIVQELSRQSSDTESIVSHPLSPTSNRT